MSDCLQEIRALREDFRRVFGAVGDPVLVSGKSVKSVLTPQQEQALAWVGECFGRFDEYLRFCRFLVEVKQGRKWLECPIPADAWESAERIPSTGR